MKKLAAKFLLVLFLITCLALFPKSVKAESNKYATIVNPVRMAPYNKDVIASLVSEYGVIRELNIPATWLLTYDIVDNKEAVKTIKSFDSKQELGIFLEVTDNFSKKSKVNYNNSGFWHHANSVFLSGYSQEERTKLVDTVFSKFKETFGYYPKSVGSWWTDSFSLDYIYKKYGVIANIVCADQFATDGYQIWGIPWMTPFYPSKYHAGVPAQNPNDKIGIVSIQWAFRDPINGYKSSLFSTQDYLMTRKNLDFNYFQKLVNLYLFENSNEYSQITVGLEADLDPATYEGEYRRQLKYIKELSDSGKTNVVTMGQFGDWYKSSYPNLSPQMSFSGKDILGTNSSYYWVINNNYRLYYSKESDDNYLIRDLRIYYPYLSEPYYISPNRMFNLAINTPSLYDEINDSRNVQVLSKDVDIIEWVEKKVNKEVKKVFPANGIMIKGLSSEAMHFFKTKRFPLELIKGRGWNYFKKVSYVIPQEELYALKYLSRQPKGKVLVYDGECLQCEYHTEHKPPFMANLRDYVSKYSKNTIVYNSSLFNLTEREKAKQEINKLNVKYIYLVKFEGYQEKLPFSPGDLGIEKIFENANSVIWKRL